MTPSDSPSGSVLIWQGLPLRHPMRPRRGARFRRRPPALAGGTPSPARSVRLGCRLRSHGGPGSASPAKLGQYPPSASGDDASRYARLRYRAALVELLGVMVFLVAYQLLGFSDRLAAWVSDWMPWQQVAGYLAVFALSAELVFVPLHWWRGFLLEHRFGLSRMTARQWLIREGKHGAVNFALGLVVCEGLYALLRSAPASWPLWATIGWVVFSVVLARLFPTVLLPIFYKIVPVQDAALVARLVRLCERTGVKALGVFRFDLGAETRKANAALAGMGNTRRVLVSDTLLFDFTPEEIEGVLGHELGHHRYRHITQFLVLSAVGSWIACSMVNAVAPWWVSRWGWSGLADLRGFPLLMLVFSLLNLIGMPLQHAISRAFEWQADRFAVHLTGAPQAFASALDRLATLNLADRQPPRWAIWLFYDHPPITERIQAAQHAALERG